MSRTSESVQRAASRLISGFKELSYEQRLRSTGLTTLEVGGNEVISSSATIDFLQERRTLTHISSSISQITHMVFADTVSSYPSADPVSTSGKTFSSWNSLFQHVVDATSVNTSMNRRDAHWKAIGYGQ